MRSPTSTAATSTSSKGDHDRAITDYTEAIRLNPKSDIAYMRRAEAWLSKGDNLAALRDADQAVGLDANDPANYQTRAAVMKALSRNDDAINDLEEGADAEAERYAQAADRKRTAGVRGQEVTRLSRAMAFV